MIRIEGEVIRDESLVLGDLKELGEFYFNGFFSHIKMIEDNIWNYKLPKSQEIIEKCLNNIEISYSKIPLKSTIPSYGTACYFSTYDLIEKTREEYERLKENKTINHIQNLDFLLARIEWVSKIYNKRIDERLDVLYPQVVNPIWELIDEGPRLER